MYHVSNELKAALSSQLLHIRICTEAGTELDHDTLTYTASCVMTCRMPPSPWRWGPRWTVLSSMYRWAGFT